MTTATATATLNAVSSASLWEIDPAHSGANFTVKHMMISKVHGGFTRMIDASSIDTREPKRDEHLRSADFFDVAKFPTLEFRSREFREAGEGLEILGDLTLHGVTREVVLVTEGLDAEMKDPWGNLKLGASATTRIKRKEFGLSWNAALEIQFIKKS